MNRTEELPAKNGKLTHARLLEILNYNQIKLNGKRKGLGLFLTELEAHQAYMRAFKVGTQPDGAVMVPGSEREVIE